jgi:hypothetical protein
MALLVENVYACIERSCFASNPREQEQAMQQLENFGCSDGLVDALVKILQGEKVSADARTLAVICLKNTVKKFWVARGSNPGTIVGAQEKALLRQFLSTHFGENDARVLAQLAQLVAQVVRRDWPGEWPDALECLFHATLRDDTMVSVKAFYSLYHVLKELSTKRIAFARSSITAFAVKIFPRLVETWNGLNNDFIAGVSSLASGTHDSNLEILGAHTIVMLNIQEILLKESFKELSASMDLLALFQPLFQCFHNYLAILKSIVDANIDRIDKDDDGNMSDDMGPFGPVGQENKGQRCITILLIRMLKSIISIPVNLHKQYPLEMAQFLSPLLELSFSVLVQCRDSYLPEKVGTYCVRLLSNTLGCNLYVSNREDFEKANSTGRRRIAAISRQLGGDTSAKPSEEEKRNLEAEERASDEQAALLGFHCSKTFFTPDRMESLAQLLLTKYMQLTDRELQEWQEEPESFLQQQDSRSEMDSIASACELLFLNMIEFDSETISRLILSLLEDVPRQSAVCSSETSSNELLFWDSVYLMVGLGTNKLSARINTSQWLSSCVGPMVEALIQSPSRGAWANTDAVQDGMRPQILRKRILWVLSCWSYLIDGEILPQIIVVLSGIIDKASCSDIVSTMQAIETLGAIMNVTDFKPTMLTDQLLRLLESLCIFIVSLEDTEHRAQVVSLISELVENMNAEPEKVRPMLCTIAQYIAGLWTNDEDNSPLRPAILAALNRMTQVAGHESASLHPLLLPLIQLSVAPPKKLEGLAGNGNTLEEEQMFLFGDALTLWCTVIRNCSTYTEQLDAFFKSAVMSMFPQNLTPTIDVLTSDPDFADLRVLMTLIEGYVIIGQKSFVTSNAECIDSVLKRVVGKVRPRDVPYIIRPLEAMLLVCVYEGAQFLVYSGMLQIFVRTCCAAMQKTSPELFSLFQEDAEDDLTMMCYLSAIAQAFLFAPSLIQEAVGSILVEKGVTNPSIFWRGIVRLLLDKLDNIGILSAEEWRAKLWCIALLGFLPTNDEMLLQWVPEIIIAIDGVRLKAAAEGSLSPTGALSMATREARSLSGEYFGFDDGSSSTAKEEHLATHYRRLIEESAVTKTDLLELVSEKMNGMCESLGLDFANQIVQQLPEQTRRNLKLNL